MYVCNKHLHLETKSWPRPSISYLKRHQFYCVSFAIRSSTNNFLGKKKILVSEQMQNKLQFLII